MDKYTANRYITLKNQIAAGSGSVPQELIDEVNALDATVNGNETQEPPVIGLVDIVGDLENTVEDLDLTVNGDSTTAPETPGLIDRVEDLELSVNGDPEAMPPILPTVGNVRMSKLWENSNPTLAFEAGDVTLSSGDYDLLLILFDVIAPNSLIKSCIIRKGDTPWLDSVDRSQSKHTYARYTTAQTDTVLTFTGGYYDGTASDMSCVPIAIYGIKLL